MLLLPLRAFSLVGLLYTSLAGASIEGIGAGANTLLDRDIQQIQYRWDELGENSKHRDNDTNILYMVFGQMSG
jgi:hypothetical protein